MNQITAILTFLSLVFSFDTTKDNQNKIYKLDLSHLKYIGEVDKRFQSFNIEMCEVAGGDFWIPYNLLDTAKVRTGGFSALKRTIPSINLYEKKLRTLADALRPMYIRVSGTWANTTYFQDNDAPKLSKAPEGYENVLTRSEWKGVIDFCKATDSKLMSSFAISDGMRDKDGNWTSAQMKPLINYTKSIDGEIAVAEMFNEPSISVYGGAPKGYDAAWYARDFAAFKSFANSAIPEMKILGPGSVGEGERISEVPLTVPTDKMLTANPKPDFDIFSYHFYGSVSKRCNGKITPEEALTEEWLSKTETGLKYYKDARDKYLQGVPIWCTETAEAACGGDPWAATYTDCFRYLEQLGRLAKNGVQVVMHNTLCAGEYALLDNDTHNPRPNYWAALLWNKLMGTKVYDAGLSSEGLDIYVHNLKKASKGYAVLIVNPKDAASSIEIPVNAEQYLFTADNILSKTVKLNGEVLKLKSDETLPEIKGKKIQAGKAQIPAHSIVFLSIIDKDVQDLNNTKSQNK